MPLLLSSLLLVPLLLPLPLQQQRGISKDALVVFQGVSLPVGVALLLLTLLLLLPSSFLLLLLPLLSLLLLLLLYCC